MGHEFSGVGFFSARVPLMRKVLDMGIQISSSAALALLLGLGLLPSAQAFTSTGNMDVSATIETSCSVSASPMAFGVVQPGIVKETEAIITAVCTSGTTYTLDLGDGLNHITTGGTGSQYRRQMASAANRLPYVIYIDATRATAIDASAAGTLAYNNLLTSTVGNGLAQPVTIYGRVVGAESLAKPPGSYNDTVVVTIAF
jgi:spore coat protein U-like protein